MGLSVIAGRGGTMGVSDCFSLIGISLESSVGSRLGICVINLEVGDGRVKDSRLQPCIMGTHFSPVTLSS